ncbi:MAG: serine--tRNA ligase, partial [Desulfobacteraceae bacterium]|nr:serine--tRNA ligase [Desulfobacteraceae bacterium]
MLEHKFVRSNFGDIKEMIKTRGYDLDISRFETLDQERRGKLSVLEGLRHQRNRVNEDIAAMKKRGEDASNIIAEMKDVSSEIKEKEKELPGILEELNDLLMVIPNIPDESVPVGKDENDNPVIRTWGEIREVDFAPRPHWEIGEGLGILDFECAAKLAGSRFA